MMSGCWVIRTKTQYLNNFIKEYIQTCLINSTQQPHVNINKDASNNDINNVQVNSHRTDM